MRNSAGIEIHGSSNKQKLMQVGYYHGFKGYRFYNKASDRISFQNFSELCSVIEFDENLKAILYQPILRLETALKSYTCNDIMEFIDSCSFSILFEKGFYTTDKDKTKKYKTRDQIYSALTKRYQTSEIVKHYYNKDEPVPLWAIFEELTLGDLSLLIESLTIPLKIKISKSIGIPTNMNTDGVLLPQVMRAIKDLRNAIAHNKVIYDGRYITFRKRQSLIKLLAMQTSIPNIKFDGLFDDVILICFLMYNLKFTKSYILKIVGQIEAEIMNLHQILPNKLFQAVAGRMFLGIPLLKKYVKGLHS